MEIPASCRDLLEDPAALDAADGFLSLSSARWRRAEQSRLVAALRDRPRPVVDANPEIVAPSEDGLTLEPCAFAHDLADATGFAPDYFGKASPGAYGDALARIGGLRPHLIAMVGEALLRKSLEGVLSWIQHGSGGA